jgi:hypothetical protein
VDDGAVDPVFDPVFDPVADRCDVVDDCATDEKRGVLLPAERDEDSPRAAEVETGRGVDVVDGEVPAAAAGRDTGGREGAFDP